MGCGNCSTGTGGKPGGCKGNGGCSTGGCNRLNVYDWLNALPLHDGAKPYAVIEVSFNKGSRKEFFRNNTNYILEKNDWITVEGTGGVDVGQVSLTGELVKLQLKKYGVRENDVTKRVLHPSTDEEMEVYGKNKEREADTLTRSRAIARSLNLDMKLCEVEIQADGRKGTFFYTADQRVDFRELIRVFATDFKLKVEMRQIGARQESGKVGGIGSCGRELCCSTWLTDFKSVNTTAARYQNLSINQTKLSGQCGRLKCCLNYELDTYMDALSVFPNNADSLETVSGIAHLQKRDIFKNVMWYSFHGNNKQYPLSITRVKEILTLNKEGKKAEDLQPVELETRDARGTIKAVDMGYVNDVGQITLKALEKNNSKKKKKKPASNTAKPQKQATAGEPVEGAPQAAKPANRPQPQGNKPPQQQGNKQQPKQGQPKPNNNPNAAVEGGAPATERPPKPQGQGGQQGGKAPQQQRRPNPNQGQPAAEGERPQQQQRKPNPNQGQPTADGEKPQQPKQQQGGKQGGNRPQQQRRSNQQGGTPRPDQPRPPKQSEGDAPKTE